MLDQAIEIVRKRVDEVGTNEPSITKSGSNRIAVELPGLDNPDRNKHLRTIAAVTSIGLFIGFSIVPISYIFILFFI